MNPYEITFRALLGTFLKHGICVERVNVGENTIYISLPKNSYIHGGTNFCWTKETGNENFINNIELVLGEY